MKYLTYLKQLGAVFSICLLGSSLSADGIISVNVGGSVDATRVLNDFGVTAEETVVGNWNNIGFDFANPLWNDGSESTILVETVFPWGADGDDGSDRRYGSGTIGTPLHHGPNVYPATPEVELTFSNLRANFPDGFYVIVYLGGYASVDGTADNEGVVSDGRTSFYWKNPYDLTVVVTPETLVETTTIEQPATGEFPVAHYAVFGSKEFPKISDSITFTVSSFSRAVSIGGVQLVSSTYEPDTGVENTWAGYEVDAEGYINTGAGFMGWLEREGTSNWLYSFSSQQFIYTQENYVTADAGAWIYVFNQAKLNPDRITGQWYVAEVFNTWVASYGAQVGTGGGWLYVLDLSAFQ